MEDFQNDLEIDDTLNILLINHVKERPSLYYKDAYSALDEELWDEIQKIMGIQKSWLKRRWKTIRNEHKKIILYNHFHNDNIPLHKLAKYLEFFAINLNDAQTMNFDDLKRPRIESFCVTQEMLDSCDINETVTADSISVPKLLFIQSPTPSRILNTGIIPDEPIKSYKIPMNTSENKTLLNTANKKPINTDNKDMLTVSKKFGSNLDTTERCEDIIFGELVVATLKKMTPEDKKRAKKEIMNILF
ncbi:uncharacterized protein LOC116342223 [Contarinia nasturtii]|uniref:uncharacterized protein LOC116342223 n=1 Tax=Contarinia nasturtii TaxID=265458 RepID=UPI0012D498C2|nr:uncharacterized protein LOC116342223 [Contarinia nasturtii]